MHLTKFEHSCFYLEKDGRGLLFDPVEYEHKLPTFDNLDAIIITHLHGDHFQPAALKRIRTVNPNAQVFTTADNTANVPESTIAKAGDKITSGVFDLVFFGQDHAAIIPDQVPCQNLGIVVDGFFANSGDSFDIPPVVPQILVVPIAAPWLKIHETSEFIRKIQPKIVIPSHDALNSQLGNTICDNWISKTCDTIGAEYKPTHYGKITETKQNPPSSRPE